MLINNIQLEMKLYRIGRYGNCSFLVLTVMAKEVTLGRILSEKNGGFIMVTHK